MLSPVTRGTEQPVQLSSPHALFRLSCRVSPTGWSRARTRSNSEAERSRAGPNRARRAHVASLSDALRVRHRVSRVRAPLLRERQFLSSPPRARIFRHSVRAANRAPGRLGFGLSRYHARARALSAGNDNVIVAARGKIGIGAPLCKRQSVL